MSFMMAKQLQLLQPRALIQSIRAEPAAHILLLLLPIWPKEKQPQKQSEWPRRLQQQRSNTALLTRTKSARPITLQKENMAMLIQLKRKRTDHGYQRFITFVKREC